MQAARPEPEQPDFYQWPQQQQSQGGGQGFYSQQETRKPEGTAAAAGGALTDLLGLENELTSIQAGMMSMDRGGHYGTLQQQHHQHPPDMIPVTVQPSIGGVGQFAAAPPPPRQPQQPRQQADLFGSTPFLPPPPGSKSSHHPQQQQQQQQQPFPNHVQQQQMFPPPQRTAAPGVQQQQQQQQPPPSASATSDIKDIVVTPGDRYAAFDSIHNSILASQPQQQPPIQQQHQNMFESNFMPNFGTRVQYIKYFTFF